MRNSIIILVTLLLFSSCGHKYYKAPTMTKRQVRKRRFTSVCSAQVIDARPPSKNKKDYFPLLKKNQYDGGKKYLNLINLELPRDQY